MIQESEHKYLRRSIELAREALDAGDEPFGSVLVSANGSVLAEERNRTGGGDQTRHPEFELARWAANHMTSAERSGATVYTSGEHCPMCAAAHAWVGLGRIVYVASSQQLRGWLAEIGVAPGPVRSFPASEIAPSVTVEGPVPELTEDIRDPPFALSRQRLGSPAGDVLTRVIRKKIVEKVESCP